MRHYPSKILSAGLFTAAMLFSVAATAADKPVTREEIALGQKQYGPNQQQQGGQYNLDPALTAYVQRVGMKLAKTSDAPDLPYEFVIINSSDLNAWALPGGKIAINRGLLAVLESEAQLAAVLAHEIAHVTKRHSARMQKKALGASLLGTLIGLGIGMKAPEYRDLAMQGASTLAYGAQANYSRDHELQADRVGMHMMSRASYDPQAAVVLQEIFLREAQGRKNNALSSFFASHPPSQERISENKSTAKTLPAGGVVNDAEYRKAIAQLNKDKPAYQYLKEASTAYTGKNYAQAIALSDKAIALQPKQGLFWEMKGQALAKQNRGKEAVAAFDRAVAAAPGFFRPLLLRGMTQNSLGQYGPAESSILAAQKLLPTQIGTYTLGELSERRGDRNTATSYYRQAAQGGGEIGKAAQKQLENMQYGN